MKSILGIGRELLLGPNPKLKYLLTYKTSQDHLELFFSCLRSRGGFNNNPSAYQLRSAIRGVMIAKMGALCTDVPDIQKLSPFVDNIATYISGYITRKLISENKMAMPNHFKKHKDYNSFTAYYTCTNKPCLGRWIVKNNLFTMSKECTNAICLQKNYFSVGCQTSISYASIGCQTIQDDIPILTQEAVVSEINYASIPSIQDDIPILTQEAVVSEINYASIPCKIQYK
ncbi:unnamed protein product [Gordionus sp. m RMFG-2023]